MGVFLQHPRDSLERSSRENSKQQMRAFLVPGTVLSILHA